MSQQRAITHSVNNSTLADILERVLDKGIVIAGDIKIKLVDVELLTIQIRLVICSVDKAKEIGLDWWVNNRSFSNSANASLEAGEVNRMQERLGRIEESLARISDATSK
jgi:Gas vesicle protein